MTNLVNENKYSSEEVDDDTYTGYVYGDMSVFQDIYNEMYTAALYNESISEKLDIIEENISNAKQGSSKAVYEELKERMNQSCNTKNIIILQEWKHILIMIFRLY